MTEHTRCYEDYSQSQLFHCSIGKAFHMFQQTCSLVCKEFDLNPTEYAVLELLYRKECVALQMIGDQVFISSGSITYVVDKLQKKGLLKRVSCETDRRITFAHLTLEGTEIMNRLLPVLTKAIQEQCSALTEEEMSLAINLLGKVT